ncbi:genetic interactor of prohibitins 3, mitochondrial [Geosmithia morbida]|uniref:Genetic interactor of prohibitins 3, mitochondrial n=1 Tax=Geosmithia morbida TaxID=1094350 RepID=A0A9P4YXZ0_9HYPO|nr:genetic interactor of prohibitins 3, mitochondrial [Geosmithia morbida]KAF4123806.1 genetic interactor of prohibitins 3, mitochondrial [Geosmithia morbida]
MHRAVSARWLSRALRIREGPSLLSTAPPTFLCPAVAFHASSGTSRTCLAATPAQRRRLHIEATSTEQAVDDPTPGTAGEPEVQSVSAPLPRRKLPVTCAGCGALSQTHDEKQLGFYNVKGKRVQKWLRPEKQLSAKEKKSQEDHVVSTALSTLGAEELEALGINPSRLEAGELPGQHDGEESSVIGEQAGGKPPVCERCHSLSHHGLHGSASADVVMYHPTVESLRETIEESPHRYNHIYHIIDAADFPMSLIPRLNVLLGDIPLRTRNRRSRAHKYMKDRQIEMSFVITRGDLLGPTKEKVDNMMPYLRDVMRDALGRLGGRIRLGNLRCVSAKRSWWTHQLKEDVWKRGGAGWMVGKVNVGKSQLFEAIYPKGRMSLPAPAARRDGEHGVSVYPREEQLLPPPANEAYGDDADELYVSSLLPPLQPARQYPDMPMVSDLPGTTASPIRIPFGNKKGELVDLPGLARSDLELFVKPEHRKSLVMKSRIVPEQLSFTSTHSLLLGGGLIRITPRTPDVTFLVYNFTPLDEHVTSTVKAIDFQNQTRVSSGVENLSLPGIGDRMLHAGTFQLKYDVTKGRAGPLTRKAAVGLKVENLPFRVLSVDILIEGVGYVEVVAQVRAKDLQRRSSSSLPPPREVEEENEEEEKDPFAAMASQRRDASGAAPLPARREPKPKPQHNIDEQLGEPDWPAVDVFSPEGRFVGSRMPIEGWLNNKPLVKPEHKRSRPRKSMRGQKKMEKMEKRAA